MTTNFSHANCSHPKTSKARAACRKAMKQGRPAPLATAPTLPRVDLPMTHLSTDGHMGLADAQRITRDLLAEHGLIGWDVSFNDRRRAAGLCDYARKRIILSRPLMAQRTWDDTHKTIIHEIAHALTPGHKHDHVWQAKDIELGGRGTRCFEHSDDTAPWIGTCSVGTVHPKYRAPKNPDALYRCKCAGASREGFKFVPNPGREV